ncbi:sodium:solute symporter family protein [Spiractinospora alimapuensis]|uniref:sodium:solute symporter family protein n=1 Tax=Spiractinospora alimapuensis TaxID=2820884 RepID=UPI001F2635A9|nr:sodium:solute symporter family protein [Spiractinospora alimapuensis]QVQ52287.1 sodium:solute symporter family protein [Spiractinospora alimapuensis]QVQ52305.1 sodium:solute symporter family protein [Spiractinospora alimapuensis]
MTAESNSVYLMAFLATIVLMLGLGILVARRNRTGEDFLLAGRRLTIPMVTGSALATLVGTGSSLGAVSLSYTNGWAGALYGLGGAVGIFLLLWLFADAREHGFMTFPEEMSFYYGANRVIKGTVAIVLFLATIGWLGAHILGGALYLSYLTGMDMALAKVVVAVGFGLYTVIGGYLAVVVTDMVQGTILFLGFTILAVLALVKVGGFGAINDGAPAASTSFFGIEAFGLVPAISLAVVIAVGVLATPSHRQRIYSAKNTRTARQSFALVGVLFAIFAIAPPIVGLSTQVLSPGMDNPDLAFPYLATEVFPLWVGALLLVSGLSATMSSGDSEALTGVTIFLRDISYLVTGRLPKAENMVFLSRIALVAVLVLALCGALLAETIIDYITTMISTVLTGLLVAALLGKFWRRTTWQGGLGAIIGGAVAAMTVNLSAPLTEFWGNPAIPSLAAALIVGVVVSLVTPRRQTSDAEALRILADERAELEVGTHLRRSESTPTEEREV